MTRRATKKRKAAPRKRVSKPTKSAKKAGGKVAETSRLTLGEPQLRWLDSFADSIVATGGPRFRREDIVQALVDVISARSLDPRSIRSLENLRNAFGTTDLSAVERVLEERPKLEPSLLAALKDSIK